MRKALNWIDNNFEMVLGSAFLVTMVLFTSMQIFGRHFLSKPFPFTEEMTRYMFVWLVFISLGYAVKSGSHIRITILRTMVNLKWQFILDIFADAVSLVFAAVCSYAGAKMMMTIASGGQTAVSLAFIPMWLVYLVMPLGFIIYMIRLVQDIFIKVKNYRQGKDITNKTDLFEEGE